jgi:alkylation response protein AidB-like acyl-CoA dehydrogenase
MNVVTNQDSSEQAVFRQYCRQWVAKNKPADPPEVMPQAAIEIATHEQLEYLRAWQKSAYQAGLVGCDYPVKYGGGGRTDCQDIANEEMQNGGTPFLVNIIGLNMAVPTLFYHGTEQQKRNLLPGIFSADEIWCQGFSEPGAGSDLASLQTSAELRGDKWVINGHKVWSSLAHLSDWAILLARTDKSVKHQGITYFVVPIKAGLGSGVSVRPLVKMTGEEGFNEILFEDYEVDDSMRVDAIGNGWRVTNTTLLHERGAGALVTPQAGNPRGGVVPVSAADLISLAKKSYSNGRCSADDPVMRDKMMQMLIREKGINLNRQRARVIPLNDHPMRLQLQVKVLGTELKQEISALAMELEGAASLLYVGDENAPENARWPKAYMSTFGTTIAGGSNEIQRNIIGEQVLGLPKTK